jgi:peptide/nickel transport system substrate-binding protein
MINVAADSPFRNNLVRQAVHYAVDRQRIVEVGYAGHSETWCLPWHNGSIGFTPAARDCPRDLDKARALMAEAGYGSGFATTLLSSSGESNVLMAQILSSNLAEIGINATIEQVEVPQQRWGSGDYIISVHGYGRANRDPSSLLNTTSVFRPVNNFSKFESKDYTDLVNAIGTTLDSATRKANLAKLDALLLDQMWVVSIAPSFLAYAHSDKVKGLRVNLDGMPFLEDVSLD